MGLDYLRFDEIDIANPFFDSLKVDYAEFSNWFAGKPNERAYVSTNENGAMDGFLYLKLESEAHEDIAPPLPGKVRLKVGTFKIDAHGTKLGDRFIKKLFDQAMNSHVQEAYVTVFEKHQALIALLSRFGFKVWGTKTTSNGTELVLVRDFSWAGQSLLENYPLVRLSGGRKFLLALYPEWHTRLLPDSKLIGEGPDVVADVSHTNSVQKIYLAGRSGAQGLAPGDILVVYRTSDNKGPAHYRSVATSVCVVTKLQMIGDLATEAAFLEYCGPFSVFSEQELRELYKNRKYPVIITFTYNISFPKRVTRKRLIEEVGIDPNERWTCIQIPDHQFKSILEKGQVDASFVVN